MKKKWDKNSVKRILSAIDPILLKECLMELNLIQDSPNLVEQAKNMNDFLVSLIPMPGAEELNKLFQIGMDFLLNQEIFNENKIKQVLSEEIEQSKKQVQKYEEKEFFNWEW